MAKLYFRYGAMGSSKSANILMVRYNYEERGQYAVFVKTKNRQPGWRTQDPVSYGIICFSRIRG